MKYESVSDAIELAKQGDNQTARELMLEYGLFHPIDSFGNTFVHYCAAYSVPGVIECISHYDDSLNSPGTFGLTPLMLAADAGNLQAVETLLELGVDPNYCSDDGVSAMLCAVGGNPHAGLYPADDKDCRIKGLSKHNEREKRKSRFEQSLIDKYGLYHKSGRALEIANAQADEDYDNELRRSNGFRAEFETDRINIVKALLKYGVSQSKSEIELPFGNRTTCEISAAIECGYVQCAELLIKAGYDINACSTTGNPPICSAARSCDIDAVKLLLDAGANPACEDFAGQSAIALAQYREMKDIVSLILSYSTNLENDKLSLIRAGQVGDVEGIKQLVSAGVPVDQRDSQGNTPLIWAAANMKLGAVRTLVELGADVNASNNGGITALHDVVDRPRDESLEKLPIVRYLVEHGADVNAMSQQGTPMNIAIVTHDEKVASYLHLKGGVLNHRFARITFGDSDTSRDYEWTVIWCILNELSNVLSDLLIWCHQGINDPLDYGFNDFRGMTFLSIAAAEGKTECARALVSCGIEIDAENDETSFTPLMMAVLAGNFTIADFLVNSGADTRKRTPEGFSALECALYRYETENDFGALAWARAHY